jgi:hypothetical protein
MPKSKTWHPTYAIFNGFANIVVLPHALTYCAHFKNLFLKQHWDENPSSHICKKITTKLDVGQCL